MNHVRYSHLHSETIVLYYRDVLPSFASMVSDRAVFRSFFRFGDQKGDGYMKEVRNRVPAFGGNSHRSLTEMPGLVGSACPSRAAL
jgi:hypothetical protein